MGGRNRLLTQFAGAVLCVQLCATVPSDGATVSIDPTITYSTIDGLGFCAPPKSMYKVRQGPFMVDAEWEPFAETLITYVGMTMSRGFDTRSCEFNPSPGEYVITASIREEMEKQRLLQHIADSCGEPYHFAPNVFSPAPWMKANNACSEGANSSQNRLEADHYADFAAMCSAYVRISIDMFEVPVYALSPQNEPAFSLTYASCVYTARSYTDMLRFVGPAVERASPTTLIYGCEHMLHVFPSWERTVLADDEAGPYLDRFAFHSATSPTNIDTAFYSVLTRDLGRDVWTSELNWKWTDYDTCFMLATAVINRLGDYANMTGYMAGGGYLFWDPAETGGAKTHGYYMNAQFMRFVRPGMTRVKTTTSDSTLRAIAYKNDSSGSFSLVMLNASMRDMEVALNSTGGIPDSLEMRTTTQANGFAEGEVHDGSSALTVPARSIVSLGYRIRNSGQVAVRRTVNTAPRPNAATCRPVRVFDLRGRIVNQHSNRLRQEGGVASVVVGLDARGQAHVAVRKGLPIR